MMTTPNDEDSKPVPPLAKAPHILLDALPVGMQLDVWRRQHTPAHRDYAWATVRLGELIRSIDPDRALMLADEAQVLGASPVQVAQLRASASLECNRVDDARSQIAKLPAGPWRALLTARAALLDGDLTAGRDGLDELLASTNLPPDVHAEALSFRARAHPEDGVDGMLDDLLTLEELCLLHNATLTGVFLGMWRSFVASDTFTTMARVLSAGDLARKLTDLTGAADVDPATVAPVPLHVHIVFVRLRDDPRRAVEELITLAGLFWQSGLPEQAHKTAVYAARIGPRLLGEQAGRDLADYLVVLRRHAGEERWRVLSDALADEERQHLSDRA